MVQSLRRMAAQLSRRSSFAVARDRRHGVCELASKKTAERALAACVLATAGAYPWPPVRVAMYGGRGFLLAAMRRPERTATLMGWASAA